jgi:hypothetical protein
MFGCGYGLYLFWSMDLVWFVFMFACALLIVAEAE